MNGPCIQFAFRVGLFLVPTELSRVPYKGLKLLLQSKQLMGHPINTPYTFSSVYDRSLSPTISCYELPSLLHSAFTNLPIHISDTLGSILGPSHLEEKTSSEFI